ncbi:MAG: LuxR family transcriptional regulator [Sandaracinaceae bacterium]|nr:MAG: LuxR family transcriptional regulator [Sandaracinaceae bacterium]
MCATVHEVESAAPALTPAELRVLKRLDATGGSNAELGRDLGIATETVRTHLERVLVKLDARNRTHALARARERGVLLPRCAPHSPVVLVDAEVRNFRSSRGS